MDAFPLAKYITKRLLWFVPVMIGVVVVVYTISFHMPGRPMVPMRRAAALGMDRPFIIQLGTYLWRLVTKLDLGASLLTNIPITEELARRLPITFRLSFVSILLMLAVGLPCGILSAIRQNSAADIVFTSMSLCMASLPNYVVALLGALLFGVILRWLPVTGLESWQSWILPVFCSAANGIATYVRMTRMAMLEVIRQDYIRTARAKGMRESDIVRRHALRNCIIPLVTVIGLYASTVLAGSIIVEAIFNIQGIGLYLMDAILSRDYPVVNAVVVTMSLMVCLINLLVDIAYALIDPRIKTAFVGKG